MKILTKLNQEQKTKVTQIVNKITDYSGDFYITQNNLRLYIRENLEILFNLLDKGDKIVINHDAIGIIVGHAEKTKRKYVKLLSNDKKTADEILQLIILDSDEDLWVKIKNNNSLLDVFKNNGFFYYKNRGAETLFKKSIKINL